MCHSSNEPIFITKNGYGDMVIMSIETYEQMNQLKQYAHIFRELALAEKDVQAGKTMDARDALDELSGKHGL